MGNNKLLLNLHEHKFVELETFKSNTQTFQANINASLKNLETQVGLLDLTLQNQTKDAFPSDTQKNPRDCMAVQLRSGKEMISSRAENKEMSEQEEEKETEEEDRKNNSEWTVETENKLQTEQHKKNSKQKQKEKVQAYMPIVPFPQRLQKAKIEEQFSKFLEIFNKIEINIPFADAITKMPNYAKFLKDILSKKKKIAEEGVVNLTATCSAIIQKSLPAKMKDPSSFTIPCTIGKYEFKKALCDSGASINLIPLSFVQRLSLGELTPTAITLQMAYRSMAQPEEVLEDVLVKVGKFIFSVDFVIMKMEEDTQVPLLLGRPFLETGVALIDLQKGELTLRVGNEAMHFNLNKILAQSNVDEKNCMTIANISPISLELNSDCNIQHSINENDMNFQYLKSVDYELLHSNFQYTETVLSLIENSQEKSSSKEKKATEQETSIEGLILKELPSHLKYAFLEPKKVKPIIISATLTEDEEQKLLKILTKYKEAIA